MVVLFFMLQIYAFYPLFHRDLIEEKPTRVPHAVMPVRTLFGAFYIHFYVSGFGRGAETLFHIHEFHFRIGVIGKLMDRSLHIGLAVCAYGIGHRLGLQYPCSELVKEVGVYAVYGFDFAEV